MATKREGIDSLVKKTMINRDIASNTTEIIPKEGGRFTPPPKRQVQIRFDPGDYEELQMIAYRKGTKAAALIREAVKDILKKETRNNLYDQ